MVDIPRGTGLFLLLPQDSEDLSAPLLSHLHIASSSEAVPSAPEPVTEPAGNSSPQVSVYIICGLSLRV